jgi:gas vesicle protein
MGQKGQQSLEYSQQSKVVKSMSKSNRGSLVIGLVVGTAMGAVAGVLLAPRKGQETRQILQKVTDALPELAADLTDSLKLQTDRLSSAALENWDGTLDRLQQALNAGLAASQSVTVQRLSNANDTRVPTNGVD